MRLILFTFVLLARATAAAAQVAPEEEQETGDRQREVEGETIVVSPVDGRSGQPGDLVSPEGKHADAERALSESGFVTVVRTGEHEGETLPLAEALADTVGAYVRSLGGLAGFATLSVRGAPSGHTAVVVDGVPLARLGSVTVDLGRFDPASFSTVALHRGGVPVTLGGAAQESVLELTTRVGPAPGGRPLYLTAGAGSFGARHLGARYVDGDEDRGTGLHLAAGYSAAEGDFRYFDDNGTPLNQSDDRTVRRRNNGHDQVDATARAALAPAGWRVTGGGRWLWKRQGVPGSATLQSDTASLTTASQLLDVGATRPAALGRPSLTARAAAYVLVELGRYRDLDGEIGLGSQDRRYLTTGGGAQVGLDADLDRAGTLATAAEVRGERFADTDLADDAARRRATGTRWELAASADHTLAFAGDRLRVVPALRGELHRTRPGDLEGMAPPARTDLHAIPRLSVLLRLAPALAVKGNVGRAIRAPTALELYGDRGFIVGNPSLRTETSFGGDVGLVVAPPEGVDVVDRVYLEAVAFASRSHDTIVLVPTAALVATAQNLGTARVWGAELLASARFARLITATTHYTQLHSRQSDTLPSYEGKELPQRPRHQLYGRLDAALRRWQRLFVVWGDAAVTSGNHLDPANLEDVPRRSLLGAGLKVEVTDGLLAALEGKNLTDERIEDIELDPPPSPDLTSAPRAVSDFFGYPLPGRAFYLTLSWEH